MQQGRPEALEYAAVEETSGSDAPSSSLKQNGRAASSEEATDACVDLARDPRRAKGSAGESEDCGIWSGSTSNAAGDTTGDGYAAVSEGSSTAKASDVPSSSSSSSASEGWAGVSHTYMQNADEADSGWTTVRASRRRVRRQAEKAAPASLHRATTCAAAPLLKPSPVLKASRVSAYKARLPEAPQCPRELQVRHWNTACSAHII